MKAHRTRTGHFDCKKEKVTQTAETDSVTQKRKARQNKLSKVKWGERAVDNVWQFKYLGSIFEAGGGDMMDVHARITMTMQRFGKLRNIW